MADESPYWEPYQPQKGDRVKIRFSPECPCYHLGSRVLHDGATGTIVGRWSEMFPNPRGGGPGGHDWNVKLDKQAWDPDIARWITGVGVAARELVRLASVEGE